LPKDRLAGDRVTPPVPLKLIVCGLLEVLSAIEIDPAKLPVLVGLKVTVSVQDACRRSPVPPIGHLSLSVKGAPGFVMLEMMSAAEPVFVKTTDFVTLVPIA
jgi:hypothetical protein